MSNKQERDYIVKHRIIRQKTLEMTGNLGYACVDVSRLASELEMDIRTVKSHLKVMEMDMLGVFMDADEKHFCTKEGVSQLAGRLETNI